MGERHEHLPNEDVPGPGQYEGNKIEKRTILGVINPLPDHPEITKLSPGPGYYNPEDGLIYEKAP
jgi:hypothetical protein